MKEHETHRQMLLCALRRFELGAGRAYELAQEVEAELAAETAAFEARRDAEPVTATDANGSRAWPWSAKAKPADLPPWPKKPRGRGYVRVFDEAIADAFIAALEDRYAEREDHGRAQAAARRMRQAGVWRRAVAIPPDFKARLAELEVHFPNFAAVTRYVGAMLSVARNRDGVIAWLPMLLVGPAGVGKTMFAEALAKALRLSVHRIDMAAAQCGSRLAGSEDFWSNSKPGLVFDVLAFGDQGGVANPVILLDEIDKVRAYEHDPVGALYTLLEPRTARAFGDLAFPSVPLDASRILWIATANEAAPIPEPLLSRMRHFSVPQLSPQQARALVLRIYRQSGENFLPGVELPELGDEAVERLAALAPRSIQKAVTEAFGLAAAEERGELRAGDFPVANEGQRKVGFV